MHMSGETNNFEDACGVKTGEFTFNSYSLSLWPIGGDFATIILLLPMLEQPFRTLSRISGSNKIFMWH